MLGSPWAISYEYDRFGNRLASHGTASTPNFVDAATMADPSTNRILGWEYDLAGNLLDDGSHHLVWDAAGRMTAMGPSTAGPPPPLDDGRSSRTPKRGSGGSDETAAGKPREGPPLTGTEPGWSADRRAGQASSGTRPRPRSSFQPAATYVYDYKDRRAAKTTASGGHVYFWDEAIGEVIWEFPTGSGTQEVVRGWLDGRLVLENDTRPGGGLRYFFRDHLGSTQVTADYFTGAPVCSSYFHPFGQSADSSGCDVHTRKFTSKERDPESGLDYFGARYYDTIAGRFSSSDPVFSADTLDPQTWNRYSYVRNGPLTSFDPDGRGSEAAAVQALEIAAGLATIPGAQPVVVVGAVVLGAAAVTVIVYENREAIGDFFSGVGESIGNFFSGESKSESTTLDDQQGGAAPNSRENEATAQPQADTKGKPKPSPNFMPPTNPPQSPPAEADLPSGHTVRQMPATEQYPNGYWVQHNEYGQPVNPATGKPPSNVTRPEARAQTHVPLPPPKENH